MQTETVPARGELIQAINDRCSKTFVGCVIVITQGVEALEVSRRALLLKAVREFDAFDEGNDPWKEHDLGSIDMFGETWLFKFDYYDQSMKHGSNDP
jgi:hypothetical protein